MKKAITTGTITAVSWLSLFLICLSLPVSCSKKPTAPKLGARLAAAAPGTVAFVAIDTTTSGNWTGKYGSSASAIPLGPTNVPQGTTITEGNASTWAWASSTNDARGLQLPAGSRTGTCWYNTSFTVTVAFADGLTHQVALYLADWDSMGRTETIAAGADTRSVSSFVAGEYLVYNVTGGTTFTLTANAGPNAVVNGIFIDPASGVVVNPPPPPPPPPPLNNAVTVINPSPGTYTLSPAGVPGQHVTATISNGSGSVPASGPFVTTVTVAFGKVVSLTWNASAAGVTGYKVYKAAVSGGPYAPVGPAPAANYQDGVGIASGQTWFYVVTELTSGGESGYSNEVKAVIP